MGALKLALITVATSSLPGTGDALEAAAGEPLSSSAGWC
jgi:hypothetical protein